MPLAAQPHRPGVVPVPVSALVVPLSGVPPPGQLLYLFLEHPAHLRQSKRNQLPDQLHSRVQLQRLDLLPTHLARFPKPPVLLAPLNQPRHPSHRWPPSSFVGPVACSHTHVT